MLTTALSASLSGMSRSGREFTIITQNITNAEDPNYAALKLNTRPAFSGNTLSGVDMISITARVDEVLQGRLYERTAQSTFDQDVENYYQQIMMEFGPPIGNLGLDKQVQRLFSAIDNLASQPASVGIKQIAALEFQETARNLTTLSGHLYQMQLDIDQRLYTTTIEINKLLSDAHTTSRTMYGLPDGSMERVKAEQDFRATLEQLAQYFEIYSYTDEMQKCRVFSTQGDALVGDVKYFLKYKPQETLQNFIDGAAMNELVISAYGQNGADLNINHALVRSAPVGLSENHYNSGRLGALLKVRDEIIPELLSQIDNVAKNIKEHFNKAHNLGGGFPPANALTSTKLLGYQDIPGFSGKARIVVVDDIGNQVAGVPALTLDLDKLETGNGNGQANIQGIMQEIQYHFGNRIALDKSIALGNVGDIKLASRTKDITPGGNFLLDLEVTNFSQLDATVEIQNVVAQDNLGNNILGSWNNVVSNIPRGNIERTGSTGASLNLALPGIINYPFTVEMQVKVNDGVADTISTLRYIIHSPISNPINGLLNQRFSVDSKVNALDPGTINFPTMPAAVLSVGMVNQRGANVSVSDEVRGLMKISSSSSSYRLVIDNLDSKHTGNILNNTFGSDRNFSSYFGLNDLFVRSDDATQWQETKNTALYLAVREDITKNSALLSTAILRPKINPADPNFLTHEYQINVGDNVVMGEMQKLASKNVSFSSAGGLAAVDTTISRYTESIIGFTANMHDFARVQKEQSTLLKDTIFEKIQNIRGVDINEEMMNMIIFQHSFSASAKIVGVVKEMLDTMINMF